MRGRGGVSLTCVLLVCEDAYILYAKATRAQASCHDRAMRLAEAVLVAALAGLAGCGSHTGSRPAAAHGPGAGQAVAPVPSPRFPPGARGPADKATLAVIRGWSDSLRRGDVRGAAHYFALPSLLINGPYTADGEPKVTAIRTFAQAVSANATLPCGAVLVSAQRRGRYVNALFRLTDRPGQGGGCGSGVGGTARTSFLIRGGRIVEWIRAPDQPGDNGGQGSRPPAQV